MSSQARKPKVKWTERMNKDVLECKIRAKEHLSSENPPCNANGRKRGYIDHMKELWDDMGWAHLELKSQHLRDQASRLEKMNMNGTDVGKMEYRNTGANADFQRRNTTANESIIQEYERSENQNSRSQQSQNADETSVDLHTTSETLPEESLPTIEGDYSATQKQSKYDS